MRTMVAVVMVLVAWRAEASCISAIGACFCDGSSAAVLATESVDGGVAVLRVETATSGLDAGAQLTLATEPGEAVGSRWFFTTLRRSPIDGGTVQCPFLPGAAVSVELALQAASTPSTCAQTLAAKGIAEPAATPVGARPRRCSASASRWRSCCVGVAHAESAATRTRRRTGHETAGQPAEDRGPLGAGISAESGLPTFRDVNGLWREHSWSEVASPEGWARNPQLILDFFDARRAQAWVATPNAAHLAIASLERRFEVVVIAQNVDELHERAGSSCVLHVHGNNAWARRSTTPSSRYRLDGRPLRLGETCADGSQLRPDVVWFGEPVPLVDECRRHVATAAKVLVVGTSLTVFPVAALCKVARGRAEKVIVSLELERRPWGYTVLRGPATALVPPLVARWLRATPPGTS
ncbi:MAG: Sir2 family NAD-dependent protein deacetylase [Myxococcota bacterium]